MGKIKNQNYRKFLDHGEIETLGRGDLTSALKNVGKGRHDSNHLREARALLITLYFTGARPAEVLEIRAKDVQHEDSYVTIKVVGKKGGLTRKIYLPFKDKYAREVYDYATGVFNDMLLFYHFRSAYQRTTKGEDGEIHKRVDTTDKLRYWVKKWFTGVVPGSITPYFLRHNRFSKLAERGVDINDIRVLKGAKRVDSVIPYVHLSTKKAKDLARHIK